MADKEKRLAIFGSRFRELRGDMSQAEFAKKIGITPATVGYYENSDRLPDAEMLRKICETFHVSADYLLGIAKDKTTNIEIKAVCELTGLNDNNVEILKNLKETCENKDINPRNKYMSSVALKAINFMLENENNSDIFMLTGRYFYDKYSTNDKVMNKETNKETSRVKFFNETARLEDSLLVEGISNSIFSTIQEIYVELKKKAREETIENGKH